MKNSLAILVPTVCLSILSMFSLMAKADTLSLVSVSAQSGGEYIYPYNFSVNGASTLTGLMCLDLNRTITVGETWQVTEQGVTSSNLYKQEAYIFSQLGQGTYSDSDVQWAAWSIFDAPGVHSHGMDTASVNQLLSSADTAVNTPGMLTADFYSQYQVYIPTNDMSGWTMGIPQEFIGKVSPVPEPSSLVLLSSGLLGAAGMVNRRIRRA